MSGKMPAGNQGRLSSANTNSGEGSGEQPSLYGVYICAAVRDCHRTTSFPYSGIFDRVLRRNTCA